jgi:hypothetical protein
MPPESTTAQLTATEMVRASVLAASMIALAAAKVIPAA